MNGSSSTIRTVRAGSVTGDSQVLGPDALDSLVGNLCERLHHVRVELGAGFRVDDLPRLRKRRALAVGAIGGDRVERVGHGEEACGQTDAPSGCARGISVAVPALVMPANHLL